MLLVKAARGARRFVESVKGEDGTYLLDHWPRVHTPRLRRPGRGSRRRDAGAVVMRLRFAQRLTMGFLDPVGDALFLVAGLRRMGIAASFHLGREMVPVTPPSGFYAWVQCGEAVVSTSLPVRETYIEVHRSERDG
ncbi:lasso peptide biosynthesis protein [Streptomyces flavidovirens]|uniref:Lasso peptide biosynthesis protein n=1 Tax=Streptomyces flavidovirens TaxID=67298 RepID=A0ABW6RGM2_9ACTN